MTFSGSEENIINEIENQRAQDEQVRAQKLRLYREIFLSSNEGIAIIDVNGYYLEQNRAHSILTGFSDEDLRGQTPAIHLGEEAFAAIAEELKKHGKMHGEFRSRTKSGKNLTIDLSAFSLYDSSGEVLCHVGIKRDVTERLRLESDLKTYARQQAVIAEIGQIALTGVAIGDLMEKAVPLLVDVLNVDFCKIARLISDSEALVVAGFGWHAGIIGTARLSAGPGSQTGYTVMRRMPVIVEDLRTEDRFEPSNLLKVHKVISGMSVMIQAKDAPYGALSVHTLTKRLFTHDDIHFIQAVANIFSSVIQRSQAEVERNELLEREKTARREAESANRAKDEFLATLSHELRTPLTSILGWAKLLHDSKIDHETSERALESIRRNAQSQSQLIDDLLDVSRIVTGKLQLERRTTAITPLVQAVIESMRPVAQAKGIELSSMLNCDDGWVFADPVRLQQIVSNLLSNAVKFTPGKGKIFVKLQEKEGEVELTVRDTGRGIAPQFLPYVFDRFRQADSTTTRSHGGLGLGLAIVKHLTELHSGRVAAFSEGEGLGATFVVRFPLMSAVDSPVEFKPLDAVTLPTISGTKVLIVEDEADTREMIVALLKHYHADAKSATCVAEAIEILETWRPDVLVSDIAMPEEDGISLIRKIRSNEALNIPAIALTAYADSENGLRFLSAGYQMHLSKPVEPHELLKGIASLTQKFA